MSVRIRLQRFGKKGQPFYHVVIADGRAPRDGRFIEKIGTYNPLTHPATINLDFERAYHWVTCGAQPSDTARMILKREGIYFKKHLMGGVQKGAFTEETANAKLEAWKEEKSRKLSNARLDVINATKGEIKKRLDAEAKIKEARAALINEKRQAILAAEAAKRAEEVAALEAEKAKQEAEKAAKLAEEAANQATETIQEVPEAALQEVEVAQAEEAVVEDAPVAEQKAEEAAAE